jgi:hypothetical protein
VDEESKRDINDGELENPKNKAAKHLRVKYFPVILANLVIQDTGI